jgi:hypothetical protein
MPQGFRKRGRYRATSANWARVANLKPPEHDDQKGLRVTTTAEQRSAIRDRLSATVNWPPARNTIKRAAYAGAVARGGLLRARHQLPEIGNVYAASCPKSGSQWIKALLDHPIVRAHTGLFTLPQLDDFNATQRTRAYPAATFVPGLYVSYQAYQRLPKPYPHRLVYIFRDPRDIVVSGYFSGLQSHREYGTVGEHRAKLRAMSTAEGMLYALEYGQEHVRNMATWVDVDDPNVATWRLEDISADPERAVPAILEHCGVELGADELAAVLAETSREALQRKDLAHRKPGEESHYRKQRLGFRDLFEDEHYAAVERVVPGLVERLGYPPA